MAERRSAARVLALALALTATALAAGAARAEDVDGVDVTVVQPWPEKADRGWVPIFVDLVNGEDRDRSVRVVARSPWGGVVRVTKDVRLLSRERTRVELVTPVISPFPSACFVEIGVDGASPRSLPMSASTSWGGDPTRHVLLVSRTPLAAGEPERLSSEIGAATGPSGRMGSTPFGVVPVSPRDLSTRFEAYTSVAIVVLDARDEPPAAEAMDAILAATRLGGALAVLGPGAKEKALRVPGLAPWIAERFAAESGGAEAESFRMGFGRLVVGESDVPLGSTEQLAAVRAAADAAWRSDRLLTPHTARAPAGEAPGFEGVPIRVMTALLLVFAAVIGFGSFFAVRKTGRPGVLLLAVPALGFVLSGGLLAYGTLHQGLDVKTRSASATLLDQRSHRASTVERRIFFAGLSPGPGLRCGPGTALFPESRDGYDRRNRYSVDLSDGTLLAGAFMPVREPVRQAVLSDRAARARLDVEAEGGRLVARNGLGAVIASIALRDAGGAFHAFTGRLAPGESAPLTPFPEADARVRVSELVAIEGAPFSGDLPKGAYVAAIESPAFRDALGVELTEVEGRHVVIGILPDGEEAGAEAEGEDR